MHGVSTISSANQNGRVTDPLAVLYRLRLLNLSPAFPPGRSRDNVLIADGILIHSTAILAPRAIESHALPDSRWALDRLARPSPRQGYRNSPVLPTV
jgi:hypothetical protein